MSQPATPHIPIYGQWCHHTVYENAQRLKPTPKPTEILYDILFRDNTSANGNTLYYIVPLLHHRWRYRPPLLPSPNSLTYNTRQQSSNAASRLATRPGDARTATLFLQRPSQKYIRRGRTLPYPNLWASADPYLGEAVKP